MDLIIRYLHFLSFLILFGTLAGENLLLAKALTRKEINKLAILDLVYGLSAISTVGAGLLLAFRFGKGAAFYLHNPVFLAKLGLVILIALLSIYPTVWFLTRRKGPSDERVPVPGLVSASKRAELGIALIVPLFAVLMARGVGLR